MESSHAEYHERIMSPAPGTAVFVMSDLKLLGRRFEVSDPSSSLSCRPRPTPVPVVTELRLHHAVAQSCGFGPHRACAASVGATLFSWTQRRSELSFVGAAGAGAAGHARGPFPA